jgi:hypothetical protein
MSKIIKDKDFVLSSVYVIIMMVELYLFIWFVSICR